MRDDVSADAERERVPDALDADVVEDLDVDDDASDVIGGPALTTGHCPVRQ